MTPEEVYQIYYQEKFNFKRGFYPGPIKHWDKYHKDPKWNDVLKLTEWFEASGGQINPKMFIICNINFFKGNIAINEFYSPKCIKVYKNHIALLNCKDGDMQAILKLVYANINFIVDFCIMNNIDTLDKYLNLNNYFPIVAKHYSAGSITKYFLALIPGFLDIIEKYPKDILDEYLKSIKDNYNNIRSDLLRNVQFRSLSDNINKVVNSIIIKRRKIQNECNNAKVV